MLKLENMFENFDLVREALAFWEHDEENLEDMLGYFRISSNAVYPFTAGGKVCFLRLAPVDEKVEGDILGELEFIRYLRGQGYPALKAVASVSGEELLRLETVYGCFYASVFEGVDGVQMVDSGYPREAVYAYGRALGRLHALSAAYVPTVRKRSYADILEWIREVLEEYGGSKGARQELGKVRKALDGLPKMAENYGLVHYDFEPDNVFWDASERVCRVIDFDDGIYCWYALDLAQVWDSLEDELEGNEERLSEIKKTFLEGYAEEYAYTQETESMLALMRRFVNLRSYARLIRCVSSRTAEEPDWLAELREKLNGKIRALEDGFR